MSKMEVSELFSNLAMFDGGDEVYQHSFGVGPSKIQVIWDERKYHAAAVYSAGVKYLITHAEAYWLIDAIVSHLPTVMKDEDCKTYHFWLLKREPTGGAILTCRADTMCKPVVEQHIPDTDFPFPDNGEFKLVGGISAFGEEGDQMAIVICLPRER